MEEIAIGIIGFIAGFVIGNISKLEVRALLKKLVVKNGKKNK